MATTRPVRAMDPYAEQFWSFTRDKELRLQQCADCGKFRWPPGPTCDRCLSDAFAWTALSGPATVLSWTTFRRGYFPEYPPPHLVALELAEGPLFISCPVDLDATSLRKGMTLERRWTDGADKFGEYNLPVFGRPVTRTEAGQNAIPPRPSGTAPTRARRQPTRWRAAACSATRCTPTYRRCARSTARRRRSSTSSTPP